MSASASLLSFPPPLTNAQTKLLQSFAFAISTVLFRRSELGLFTLLASLRFDPGPDIFWTMNFVSTPVVVGSEDVLAQRMPMRVSLVRDEQTKKVEDGL